MVNTLGTCLIVSLDHPLIPVTEHVDPFQLPVSDHLYRHILSSVNTMEIKWRIFKIKNNTTKNTFVCVHALFIQWNI